MGLAEHSVLPWNESQGSAKYSVHTKGEYCMKAIISRQAANGLIPNVGTTDRTVVSHYKTKQGIRRYARMYAKSKAYRIEFFHDEKFYCEPFAVEQGIARE